MAIRGLPRTSIALAIAAVTAVGLPSSAAAESKSEAILGTSSALQAILSQQGVPQRALAPTPASYSIPRAAYTAVGYGDEGVKSGRPDVFGSVALKVGHSPLDARWHIVESEPVTGAPARFARSFKAAEPLKQLEAVNRYVNRRVQFVDDNRRFGRGDVWSTANETLRSGRGDCEDYAIAKMQLLRAAGFSSRDLYLVILRDTVRRADHAVLVARTDGRMVVLDNGTDELLDTERVSDYRPILTFASYGEWTHGYRMQRATVEVASNEIGDVAAAPASDDQRSRSASLFAFSTGFKR